ncbi:hypothetical protein AB0B01_17335 [Streptomyces sp. NPDC044571]|uniref:hypothetical protein n=1 Tax=Streptomyces sp. NPDC044571 TaxID=3155371 RepID=UPI0033D26250
MTTLGELFDAAITQLQDAAREPMPAAGPGERAALAGHVDTVLQQIRRGLGPGAYTPVATTEERFLTSAEKDLAGWLTQASTWLGRAQGYLAPGVDGAGRAGARIKGAAQAIGTVRDTISSHLGPDRAPLTPYAYLLRHQSAFDYLSGRYAEVTRAAGQVVHRIAQNSEHPGAAEAFEAARVSLDKASVLTRAATREAGAHWAAFPLALPVLPVQATPSDPTSAVTTRLAEDSERLSRAAYAALHDRDEQRLSGSDLKQLSHWTSMARLLAGRIALKTAEELPAGDVAGAFKDAAGALRESSHAWQDAVGKWLVVVDTSDPREHPALAPPSYEVVRHGRVARMPSPDPHPATVISRTSATRLGQLLFGAEWTPDHGPGPGRSAADILADAGGPGPLAASLYRLPSAGWQMSAAAPWTIKRAGATLVSNAPGHRPPDWKKAFRFYPVHRREVEALTAAYSAVMAAEQRTAGTLLAAARRAGTTVPRAVLDASAHQAIAAEQRWAPSHQVQAPQRPVPRASVPQDLMTVRRPGPRR